MGTSDVHVALARVVQKLEELRIPYAICGGMAINAHGHRRTTVDVALAERYLAAFYAAWNAVEPDAGRAAKAAEWQARVGARH